MGLPARSSAIQPLQPYHRPAIKKLDAFVEQCGRERFLAALCLTSHTDDRLDHLLTLVEDPTYPSRSIGELAVAVGFRPGELIKIIKDTALLVATAQSFQTIADHLPAITLDAVTRAQNHLEACAACDATGSITPDPTTEQPNPSPEKCKACRGRGQIFVAADADRQDRIFEMAKLLPKGGTNTNIGIGVNTAKDQAGTSVAAFGSLFTQLVAATDRIQHPDRSPARPLGSVQSATVPLDAVVVESGDDAPAPPSTSSEDAPRGHD